MGTVEKVSIALSTELLEAVRDAVDSGQYGSASEVVREALREWKLRQSLRLLEVERLRKAWEEGLASGKPEPFSMTEIKAKAHAQFNARRRES